MAAILAATTPAFPAFGQDSAADPRTTLPAAALQRYGEALARPLFSASRRPSDRPSDAISEETADNMTLQGIVVAPGQRLALVAFGDPLTVHRISEGQIFEHWTVEAIGPDRIVLRTQDGAARILRLRIPQRSKASEAGGMSVVGRNNKTAR